MSKSFLKVSEAYNKLGLSGGGTNWIRKSELIATGKCDTTKLEKYGNNDFVVDDDIVKASDKSIILDYSGNPQTTTAISLSLSKAFNPSKGFEIEIIAAPVSSGFVRIFTIHSQELRDTPREIQVYGDTSTGEISLGCITSDGKTFYHKHSGLFYSNQKLTITMSYNSDTKEYRTVINGLAKSSTINAVNRECKYTYVNGEKYYSAGRGKVSYQKLIVKN